MSHLPQWGGGSIEWLPTVITIILSTSESDPDSYEATKEVAKKSQ